MKLKFNLLLMLIPGILLSQGVLIGINYYNSKERAREAAESQGRAIALENSQKVMTSLAGADVATKSMQEIIMRIRNSDSPDRKAMKEAVAGVALTDDDFLGAWALWEPNAFDKRDSEYVDDADLGNTQGRANAYWVRDKNALAYEASNDYDGENYYTLPKSVRRIVIIPPYLDGLQGEQKQLMTSITTPLHDSGKFLGVVGVDLSLGHLSELISAIKPYDTGYAMLLSDQGTVVAAPLLGGRSVVGGSLEQVFIKRHTDLRSAMAAGKPFTRYAVSPVSGIEVMEMYLPVMQASFQAPWYFVVALPMDKVMAGAAHDLRMSIIYNLIALAFIVCLVYWAAMRISRNIGKVCNYAQAVAQGDRQATVNAVGLSEEFQTLVRLMGDMLTALFKTMDEAGAKAREATDEAHKAQVAMTQAEESRQASERSQQEARRVAAQVDAVSGRLQNAAHDLNESMDSAGRYVREQESLMGETVQAVMRITEATTQAARNADGAAEFAEKTRERAQNGAKVVRDAISGFGAVGRETDDIGAQIAELSKRTEGIGSILEMINDIADQTNLLALNAAIEAARAGEAGRGFAVVADEVRKLAEKTMNATKEVDQAVKGIQHSMKESANSVERTSSIVHSTLDLGKDAGAALEDIVSLVQAVTKQVHEIAGLCQEQSASTVQIAHTVESLSDLSYRVQEGVAAGASGARLLEPEADELGRLMAQLMVKK